MALLAGMHGVFGLWLPSKQEARHYYFQLSQPPYGVSAQNGFTDAAEQQTDRYAQIRVVFINPTIRDVQYG